MGVAVLKPEDCLKLPNPMKQPQNPWHNPNPNTNRTNRSQGNRKKRSPNTSPPSRPTVGHPKAPAKNLVMGQVKILKRGEDLKQSKPDKHVRFAKEDVDVDLGSTDCLSPDPGSVPTQIRLTESEKQRKCIGVLYLFINPSYDFNFQIEQKSKSTGNREAPYASVLDRPPFWTGIDL
ncbi:serine/arginine repetitive matrix protein 1 [Gossypium australe]|uniref:Serine/arginine repetitive matrix protein 1 n=1 Tax=Gossypium australe TaxID=47621 RepID=A0A5B6UNH5_9ROSI|nr:serine/arginine repetitive matrix protein 1 [Gossypium australe]